MQGAGMQPICYHLFMQMPLINDCSTHPSGWRSSEAGLCAAAHGGKPQFLFSTGCSSASSPVARSFPGTAEMSSIMILGLLGGQEQLLQGKVQTL